LEGLGCSACSFWQYADTLPGLSDTAPVPEATMANWAGLSAIWPGGELVPL
jgi:hypothetical protein